MPNERLEIDFERWKVDFERAVAHPVPFPEAVADERFDLRIDPFIRKIAPVGVEGKRGEGLFRLILQGLREVYDVSAVIAGGACRDLAAGVTNHKDVDVWIPMKKDEFLFSALELGWQGGIQEIKQAQYGKNAGVFNFTTIGRFQSTVQNVQVDVLLLDKPLDKETVNKFPIHAQRGIFTLEDGLVLSPEAALDVAKKQFTIDPTITDKDKIKSLLAKINAWKQRKDYHDWKIVEPDIKEWWEIKEEMKKEEKIEKILSPYEQYVAWEQEIKNAQLNAGILNG